MTRGESQRRFRRRQEQGFTIPIVMGIGMVMVLIVAALISRVQNDQAINQMQGRSEGALNAAEIGVTRLQSFLTEQRQFAAYNSSQWESLVTSLNEAKGSCPGQSSSTNQGQSYAQGQWFNAGQTNHQYRLVSYDYRSQTGRNGQVGIGTLTVEGQVTSGLRPAVSQLAVEIPIAIATKPPAPPALTAKSFKISNAAQITGDVYAHLCPDRTDPDLVPGIAQSNLVITDRQGAISAGLEKGWPLPLNAPSTAISVPVITDNLTLPRSIDSADAQGNFNYVVESDAMNNSIQLPDDKKITVQVASNQAVNLYTRGNIDLGGGQVIVQVIDDDQPHPEKLRIYGSDRTVQFSIKDSASVMAIIHAPLASGRAAATPTTGAGITGSLLLQQWDTATSQSKLPIKQMSEGLATQLPLEQRSLQLQPISSWQRPGQ